jgi:hypothetical protein
VFENHFPPFLRGSRLQPAPSRCATRLPDLQTG